MSDTENTQETPETETPSTTKTPETAPEVKQEETLSPADLLKEVNQAIKGVAVAGASYRLGSRSVTRANLTELKNLRQELAAEVEAENNKNSGLFASTCLASFEGR